MDTKTLSVLLMRTIVQQYTKKLVPQLRKVKRNCNFCSFTLTLNFTLTFQTSPFEAQLKPLAHLSLVHYLPNKYAVTIDTVHTV